MARKTDSDAGNPQYDIDSADLKAFRNLDSRATIHRRAYGAAVLNAVRTAQASALRRAGETAPKPNCASGTAHSTGAAILKAITARTRAALLACPSQERKARKPAEWQAMYDAAMAEKRARLAT